MDGLITEYIERFIANPTHPTHPCALLIQGDKKARYGFDSCKIDIYWYFDCNRTVIRFRASGFQKIADDFRSYKDEAQFLRSRSINIKYENSRLRAISYNNRKIKEEQQRLIKCECGLLIQKLNLKRHKLTKSHLKIISQLP